MLPFPALNSLKEEQSLSSPRDTTTTVSVETQGETLPLFKWEKPNSQDFRNNVLEQILAALI